MKNLKSKKHFLKMSAAKRKEMCRYCCQAHPVSNLTKQEKIDTIVEYLKEVADFQGWDYDEKLLHPIRIRPMIQVEFSNQTRKYFAPEALFDVHKDLMLFFASKGANS
jgi:hypothetical protein